MAHAWSSYVPHLVWRRLAADLPFVPLEASVTPAAVLISDLQGFTALVDIFARAGRRGLEDLTAALSGYFADLVDEVHRHGGDVLYVAGDGFFCYWPQGDADSLADTVLRAIAAGRAIQARLDGRDAGYGQRFATRIGIGAGPLTITFAGGLNGRWELIASGEALLDGVRAEKMAQSGQVVVAPAAFALVHGACQAHVLLQGFMAIDGLRQALAPVATPPRHRLVDEAAKLRPFLPPAVLERVVSPDLEWLAELRVVTVMMVDLPTLNQDQDQRIAQNHQIVRAIQEAVERFAGTIKLDVDDKGILLMAVFGLPPRVHEDDAQRAIFAAWSVQAALASAELDCGIGVASGRCFCGPVGSDLRREYVLRGPVINLAARLMQATRSYVACDEATVEAVRGRIDFETLPAISIKWKPEPVPVYRALGRSTRTRRTEVSLIGRTDEQQFLQQRLQQLVSAKHKSVVVIEAEAGLGKSTLLGCLALPAATQGVRSFTANADSIENATAYFAWRSVFAALLGVTGEVDLVTARERISAHLQRVPDVERLMPLLSSVLPLVLADNELTREMVGDVRAENTMQLLSRLLDDASNKAPTLLIIEDAHWLDSSSWALLFRVLADVSQLMMVVTARPEARAANADYARLLALSEVELMRLSTLTLPQTVALIQRRLGVQAIPAALAQFAQERVAGHPFFCEELIRAMVDAGAIAVTDGRCTVGDLELLGLPTTVEGVILSRLDRLSANAQLCLKIGAVFGRSFLSRALADTHPLDDERAQVNQHLLTLAHLDLTELDGSVNESAYRFKHVITQEVTYDLMPLAQRQPLHRAVAEWHEKNYQADLAPYFALLAHHWERAEVAERAAAYYEQAGQQALRAGAFKEAQLFFNKLVYLAQSTQLPCEPVRHALWRKGLGTAYYFLGDLKQSRMHLEQALGALDRPVPVGVAKAQRALLASAGVQVLHRLLPARFLGRRRSEQQQLEEAVACYTTLGQIYYLDGEPEALLAYLTLRGLNVGEAGGPSPGLARIMVMVAVITGLMGRPGWADWYARRAMEMAQVQGHYVASAYVYHIHALLEAQRGNWAGAKASNSKTMHLIQEIGDFNLEAEAWVVRATVHLAEGDFRAAPESWRRARALAERNANQQILCWSYLDEVDTANGLGDIETATAALEVALAMPTSATDGGTLIDKARALAVTRYREGRHAEAIDAADAVVQHVTRQAPTGYHWADFAASAVEVYLRVLELNAPTEQAKSHGLVAKARHGVDVLMKLAAKFWNVRPRAHLLRGLLARYEGRDEQALAAFELALSTAQRMHMPYEQARASIELARASSSAGDLHEAIQILASLGAEYERQRAIAAQQVRPTPTLDPKNSALTQLRTD